MLESNLTQIFQLATKVTKVAFYFKLRFFKIAQNVFKYLGDFNDKICCLKLSKIAQSGPTGRLQQLRKTAFPISLFSVLTKQNFMTKEEATATAAT